jgi:hypothetical protein
MKLIAALAIALSIAVPASTAATHVHVAFLQGEQVVRVARPGTTASAALRALIAGPTAAERSRGFRTYFDPNTSVNQLTVTGPLATVDLSRAFESGAPERRAARLAQLLGTLTGVEGIAKVQVLVEGSAPLGLVPDVSLASPITFAQLETPTVAVPVPPPLRLPAPDPATKTLQGRLIELGYLLPRDNDGRFGPATSDALLTFQKWERLDRTGMLDTKTRLRLATAVRPMPVLLGQSGKQAQILLDRQVALLISNGRVVRAISVSTGKASTPTPPGNYRVYAKIPRWWSTPFREWLPWALPFVGGIAFHQYPDVPTYPASHGCVRQHDTVARWTFNFAYVGMPVHVIARS